MNKQLFIAVLATAFSGMTIAQEAPDYSRFPALEAEYCRNAQSEACQKLAAFLAVASSIMKVDAEGNQISLTEEEQNELNALKTDMETLAATIEVEAALFHANAKNILESVENTAEEAGKEIAEKLNITDSKE